MLIDFQLQHFYIIVTLSSDDLNNRFYSVVVGTWSVRVKLLMIEKSLN